jgi:hypothetical protein
MKARSHVIHVQVYPLGSSKRQWNEETENEILTWGKYSAETIQACGSCSLARLLKVDDSVDN